MELVRASVQSFLSSVGGNLRTGIHPLGKLWLVAGAVVAVHVLLVLSRGGYSFTVAGLTINQDDRRLTETMMLLVTVTAGTVIFKKGPPARSALVHHSGFLLFSFLFIFYLANGRTIWSGDTLAARYLPVSLLREGDFDLDEFPFLYSPGGSHYQGLPEHHVFNALRKGDQQLAYYVQHSGDHYLSVYPVAGAILITPFYLPSVLGGLPADHKIFQTLEKISAAAIVALSALILYFALRRVTTYAMASAIGLIYGLGTSSLSVSSQALWQHGPSQLALSAALYGAVRSRTKPTWLIFTGFWLAFAVICRPTNVLIAVPFALCVVAAQPSRAHVLALGGLPPLVFQLVYNFKYFGNPLHSQLGVAEGFWSTPVLEGLSGLLVSPGRGLLIYSPIYIFSVWALILSWRRHGDAILRSVSIGVVLTLLLYSKWFMWWGGYSYGPRLLGDLAPLLGFSLYPARAWIARDRPVKVLFIVLIFISIYAHAVGAFIDDGAWNGRMEIDRYPERLWTWTDNPITSATSRIVTRIERSIRVAK